MSDERHSGRLIRGMSNILLSIARNIKLGGNSMRHEENVSMMQRDFREAGRSSSEFMILLRVRESNFVGNPLNEIATFSEELSVREVRDAGSHSTPLPPRNERLIKTNDSGIEKPGCRSNFPPSTIRTCAKFTIDNSW
jgi:hypothetical protein